ncbi:transcriptional regulator TetR family protein [Oceanococcus atlanticus]|uniref:Transcriptional regulator TetR family protein n=1 Tax=Oceanococcus atlanticus TaxID=1317117 RepID=A0A1Y1SCS5_9GAMM|nr:TetR/AcrR family transcriptional regulator [Oceanococcus atlanticus]ORE86421.1 transcriptional regulator TetR family protein [Oceanococcus atlanticus]
MSKRQDILDTAVELFVRQGVDNTPTSQISKVAGVATGTLFHHFHSKDEILSALVLDIRESVHAAVMAASGHMADYNYKCRFEAMWLAFIRWAMKHPNQFHFRTQIESRVNLDEETQRQVDRLQGEFDEIARQGVEMGLLKPLPIEFLTGFAHHQGTYITAYFIENPKHFADDAFRKRCFSCTWDSIAIPENASKQTN